MSAHPTTSPTSHSRVYEALANVGEVLFVIDALAIAVLASVVILGGIDPFASPLLITIAAISAVVLGSHHVWYARHRDEIETGFDVHHDRERRGF